MSRNVVLGLVFAVLLAVVAVLAYLNFVATPARQPGAGSSRTASPPGAADRRAGQGAPAGAGEPGVPRTTIVLYFQGPDVGLLFPEEREVEDLTDGNQRAKLVLRELARGPHKELIGTLPQGTSVREVYFDASGTAFVDFSHQIRDNHPGGSGEELMTVDSVVNTLVRNVPQVTAVEFLIEGKPVETLAGHVDLSRPLRPSADRLALER